MGKLKEDYLREAVDFYSKEIRKNNSLEIIEVPDERAPENYSPIEIERVKIKEGKKILTYAHELSYIVALDIMGKKYTTKEFEKELRRVNNLKYNEIIFIIGGSNGLSVEVLKKAHEKISFSPMTFPHQIMRILLLEQIGKCFTK